MKYDIKEFSGRRLTVQPRLELYSVRDFTGKEMPGLAITLVDITNEDNPSDYCLLTLSFGEFIGMKNCAYIDTNNCDFADQLLKQGMATKTQFTKESGFCEYPLWLFEEKDLREMGEAAYETYSSEYDKYMAEKMPPVEE